MFCEKCGAKMPEGSRFCMNCGAKAADEIFSGESAVQEAAVSVDSPVTEAVPASVEEEIAGIPEAKPFSARDAILETEPVIGKNTVQAPIQPSPARTIPQQPISGQNARPEQTPVPQEIPVQPAPKPQATVQTPAGTSAQQAIPVRPAADLNQTARQAVPIQTYTAAQQAETALKPEKIKPLQTWKFAGMFIITAIPVLNLIMVLIWSFGGSFNKNTRNFARAILILWIAGLVLLIVTAIVNWALIQYIWTSFSSLPTGITP